MAARVVSRRAEMNRVEYSRLSYSEPIQKTTMPVFYKNCNGQIYLLHEGKTKTGKPRYFFSMKTDGDLPEAIPDGFEVYERPGGMVYIRKIQQSPILADELKYVQDKIAPLVDQEAEREYAGWCDELTKVIPGFLASGRQSIVAQHCRSQFQAEIRRKEIIIYRVKKGDGMPIMKFVLVDEATREFDAYRWCFKGSIDDWMGIGHSGQLKELVDKYCPALGTDKFYELW